MKQYLIIVKKKNDYHSGEYEELWLPTTEDEIEETLHNLGCRLVIPDYEVVYSEFGYPEIDKMVYGSDLLALNRLAKLLEDYTGTPGELCAELIYSDCKNVYDVLSHLSNRPQLVVLETYKDIIEYGKTYFYIDFWESDLYEIVTYEEYEDALYYKGGCPLWRRYVIRAIQQLQHKKFRFTPYGLVYAEHQVSESFDEIDN